MLPALKTVLDSCFVSQALSPRVLCCPRINHKELTATCPIKGEVCLSVDLVSLALHLQQAP